MIEKCTQIGNCFVRDDIIYYFCARYNNQEMRRIITYIVALALVLPAIEVWAAKRKVVEPSYAWTISEPLGLHFPGTIDTVLTTYYRSVVPS